MLHIDLFSGIGGFAYAADQVFGDASHIFVEWDGFCRNVLSKHWPEAPIYGDIKTFTADTFNEGLEGLKQKQTTRLVGQPDRARQDETRPFLLTGGFPCQPFSAAGLRRGTSDDRYLWPEMLRVVQFARPTWVIAENVGGLATWNNGLVFETVCTDLEAAGYEVQPFIIPAAAINAPHRRDRIWFIAHAAEQRRNKRAASHNRPAQDRKADRSGAQDNDAADTAHKGGSGLGLERQPDAQATEPSGLSGRFDTASWNRDWAEVAAELCSMDDGLSAGMVRLPDGTLISRNKWRQGAIKAFGNAIVPQVAMQIMEAIKSA